MARTAAQKAATAKLVALNAARRTGTAITVVRERGASVARRASTAREGLTYVAQRRRGRGRVSAGLISGGTAISIAQAKGVPGAVGGYAHAAFERYQRQQAAAEVNKLPGAKGALIKDPTQRLIAEFAGLAIIASKTQGFVRDAAIGAMGSVGAHYYLYTHDASPVDGYIDNLKKGGDGITVA